MTVTITPVAIATDTFNTFIAKVNTVIDTLGANIVSTNSSANGAVTSGNTQLTGHLHANVLSTHSLHGGNNQVANTLNVTSNVSIGNSTVNVVIGFDRVTIGGSVVNATTHAVGANVYANTTAVAVGNSTVNSVLTGTGLTTGLSVSNQIGHYVGANVALTASSLGIGNSTVNGVMNSTVLVIGRIDATTVNIAGLSQNSTFIGVGANVYMNTSSHFAGNSTVNAVLNSVALVIGGHVVNSTTWSLGTTAGNTTVIRNGANVVMETTRYFVGNSIANAVLNSIALVVGTAVVNSSLLGIGTSVVNSTHVAAGSNVFMNTTSLAVGNSTANVIINGAGLTTTGTIMATGNVTSSLYIFANHFNMSHAAAQRDTDTIFYSSTDDYIRKNTLLGMRKSLGLNTEYFSALFPEELSDYGTTHYLCISMPFAGTITGLTRYLTAGSITVAIQINGVAVTGLNGLTANTTVQTSAASGAFTFAAGASIRVVFGGTITAADTDLSLVLEMERT